MGKPLEQLIRKLRIPFNRPAASKRLHEYHSHPRTLEDTVFWAMNFGGSGYFKVKTMQIPSEIMSLAKAVAELRPRIILEIGTARGGTLLIWASLASERVISCDIQDMSIQRELYEAFSPPYSNCRITLLSGDSHDPDFVRQVEDGLNGQKVDMLFIDGDHTEEGIEEDYNNYCHLVRPGGIIAFHDIVENQPLPTNQVYYFWKRVKKGLVTEEFINEPDQRGFGIGIIRVPEQTDLAESSDIHGK